MKIRVVLADDHRILREGLASILEKDLRMDVVGQAENGRATVELTRQLKPDVVVMDLHMPELNGIEATRIIAGECPAVKVLVLSMHSDRELVLEALRAGAAGYLLKDCATDELECAIRQVLAHKTYVSPDIAHVVVGEIRSGPGSGLGDGLQALTSKERQVLQLLAEGKSVKEMAVLLSVGIPTVETHKQHVMKKLELFTVAELTKFALRHGLTSLE
jgi:DNA-binding NarL/FixJ family response regulator